MVIILFTDKLHIYCKHKPKRRTFVEKLIIQSINYLANSINYIQIIVLTGLMRVKLIIFHLIETSNKFYRLKYFVCISSYWQILKIYFFFLASTSRTKTLTCSLLFCVKPYLYCVISYSTYTEHIIKNEPHFLRFM